MISGGCAQELASQSEEPRRGQGAPLNAFLVIRISPVLSFHPNAKPLSVWCRWGRIVFRVDLINRLCHPEDEYFESRRRGRRCPSASLLFALGRGRGTVDSQRRGEGLQFHRQHLYLWRAGPCDQFGFPASAVISGNTHLDTPREIDVTL